MVALCVWIVFHDYCWLNWTIILVIVLPTIYSGVEYFIKNWDVLSLGKKN